ncbi:MAG: DinB family protein [Candidatus Promineofilum sp.]|nr:DinB family protein [Promineifilum sp.]MCW5864552.1 DinB family protein [Anaerolineae bacterium]
MTTTDKQAIKEELRAAREGLYRAITGLSDAQWQGRAYSEEGGEWRVLDLLRHVVDSERSMTALMAQVQAGGAGVSDDFDLTRWNRRVVEKMQGRSLDDMMAALAQNRVALFDFIDGLVDEDWDKKGRHGSGYVMTIAEVCQLIAGHERAHTAEILAATTATAD